MTTVAGPVQVLQSELRALERAYSPGHHGGWAARRRAELVDTCLRALFERAGAPPATALLALGGYGRGRLLPRSDLDLLLLHDGGDPEGVSSLADAVLYPLWDAGVDVGHAVRTPGESEAACELLESAAAMLDARHLAGDASLSAEASRRVDARVRSDPEGFIRRIADDADRRAGRFGSSAHLLEPELKEGGGGARDLHAISLVERIAGPGLVRDREREALAVADELLTRVRSALHLETGRRSERLLLDHQPTIARAIGFEDEPGLTSIDGLMRALFEHARQVEFVLRAAIGRASEPPGAPAEPPRSAADVLGALAEAAEAERAPSAALLDAIEDTELPAEVVWDERTRAGFLQLLRAGDHGADALEVLDRLGLLARFLPGWADVRCRPQRDPYHRFTVDAHLTHTLRAMGRILAGEADGHDPVRDEARAHEGDPDALLLGALLHDVGKTGRGSHVPIGGRIARTILERIGVDAGTRELVAFMVAEHLLLPDTATRRDLTDENLVLDVAARVASPERLAALYLLAEADARATGPAAWTPWRQTLIRELVAKVQHVLERGEMGAELAEQLGSRTERIRALLGGEPPGDVDRFLQRMPRGYLLAVEPERAARHFRAIAPGIGSREIRAVHDRGVREGTYELLVVAHDRPGVLSWIAGSLALAGLSILSAQAFTTEDGLAVDLFDVEGVWEPDVPARRWREFRTTLRRAVEGSISLEARVDEKRRWYATAVVPTPVTVKVDDRVSDFATVIEVGAPDRLGLLYDITRTFVDLGLDVHLAKVATYDGRVVDAFYVRDTAGGKLTDARQRAELEPALRARIDV